MKLILYVFRKLFNNRIRLSHIQSLAKYSTTIKILNLIKCEYERRLKKTIIKSKPYILNLELTNACNFNCPFCPTGKKFERKKGQCEITTLEKIFNELGKYAYIVTLHGWGEPLLGKNLIDSIKLAHANKILTIISTNVSLLNQRNSQILLDSGLDFLILAIDGISENTYNKYRLGGDYNNVIENSKNFINLKKQGGYKNPFVEWQFVVFKHNEHEIEDTKKIAKSIGVDNLVFIPAYTENEDNNENIDNKYKSRKSPLVNRKDCKDLWTTSTILWDGTIAACCSDYYGDSSFGNINEKPFDNIWNNYKFQESRHLIKSGTDLIKTSTICYLCVQNINQKTPSIAEHDNFKKRLDD